MDPLQGTTRIGSRMTDALKQIHTRSGIRGLFAGLSPAVIGSSVAWGAYFWTYSIAKSWIRNSRHSIIPGANGDLFEVPTPLTATETFLASSGAGALCALVTNPIWVIKTNMQLKEYPSIFLVCVPSLRNLVLCAACIEEFFQRCLACSKAASSLWRTNFCAKNASNWPLDESLKVTLD
eukprot:GABV01000908.1.p1 GENE.GABV01000908.1~~GABV01000908.1.p1  ORF type:complete len:179 (+),score=42.58 GABV01000908.1:252-788(+)